MKKKLNLKYDEEFKNAEILLSNYNDSSLAIDKLKLRPYEAIMYRVL